tara:strand:- start:425 stop:1021 length:597 start_codon:yes stop_codon:yes gene_type:complete
MQIKSDYFVASFISFVIHATLILYLTDFFYFEKNTRPVLSKPVNVELLFEKEVPKKSLPIKNIQKKITKQPQINQIELTPVIPGTDINNLIKEDELAQEKSDNILINEYSNLIIQSIQSAWIKPQNIQDGLVCDLRMTINKNGRVTRIDLIKSSGNIRFDNSAIKAISRVETFSFFNKIPFNLYQNNFKNIVITFNPS